MRRTAQRVREEHAAEATGTNRRLRRRQVRTRSSRPSVAGPAATGIGRRHFRIAGIASPLASWSAGLL